MVNEFYQKVLEIHNEFLKRLDRHDPPLHNDAPLILQRILECDEDILEFSLGKIGHKLRLFASKVDFSHPEIVSVFDGLLADDQEFSKECLELLLLAQYARDNRLNRIIPLLGQTLAQDTFPKAIIRKIDSPQNNRLHVRLLKDAQEREDIRLSKRMQGIDLQAVYNKGEDAWNAQPDSFSKFLRFDTAYQDDLKFAEKKVKRYEELGCNSLADEIRKSIDIFREHMEQSHYGFNRITMTNAAIILAKSMGWTFIPSKDVAGVYSAYKTDPKIIVDRKFFGKYNFDPEQIIGFDPLISEMAKSPVFTVKQQEPYHYQPRVYPLHELLHLATSDLRSIIEVLERFPDAGDKPIFDHFGVIVPGVALPQQAPKDGIFSFLDEKGLAQIFHTKEQAEKALDMALVQGGHISPVLVGEKDGKCYFISYFLTERAK